MTKSRSWARRSSFCVLALGLIVGFWAVTGCRAQATPHEVRVGIFVTSISGIDPHDGSFRIAGYLWFVDPTGTFDPEEDFELFARSATLDVFIQRTLPGGATYVL
ncbi:MAG: hypothetical protein JJ992_29130 [Planctomycetes bacterium]|nr:hypothetical protein [Planctomycetota bacterium]